MKKIIALLTMAVFILMLAGCAASNSSSQAEKSQASNSAASKSETESSKAADETKAENSDTSNGSKTLVVYFSATGTTKGVAEQIASFTGADTYEITAAQPYTSDDLNYNDSDSRTTKEQNDKSVRPEISSEKLDLTGYDTIYIGYPIWWGEEPRIMDTFVESYDFSGKTMIPFCTSGGSEIGSSGDNLEENAGSGNWLEGERLSSSSDIEEWINSL